MIEAWRIDYNESCPHVALGNEMSAEYFLQTNPSRDVESKILLRTSARYGPPKPSASNARKSYIRDDYLSGGLHTF